MLRRVLIANRGEIACRIIATLRAMRIRSVAVYSDADAGARHVRMADEAIRIGPARAADSYLNVAAILTAAKDSAADAIHPGYGFLAENAAFARQCETLGIVFIGPTADTIDVMGSKIASKQLMDRAGVPTVPGYHGDDQNTETLIEQAQRIGFPLLVKASAGGGGKGMRVVRERSELEDALAGAAREGKSAFGDASLLLEKYLLTPRHIEFQVFGDNHGNHVHLFERECSIQRRYQKIIEESPSPFLDDQLRARMAQQALEAARAVKYRGAGTVEFIVSATRDFYFMEMNTRLQVEHPVTEMITGLDLVEWQIRVASGAPLPLSQEQITTHGSAIEARVYAEDPANGFLPSTGRVDLFAHPQTGARFRVETGIDSGDTVSVHYDPMIAKLVCHGADRAEAIERLRAALAGTTVMGPTTNLSLLGAIASHPAFAAGAIDTGFIDAHLDDLVHTKTPVPREVYAAAALKILRDRVHAASGQTPWDVRDGWQANGRSRSHLVLRVQGNEPARIIVTGNPAGQRIAIDGDSAALSATWRDAENAVLAMEGVSHPVTVRRLGGQCRVATGLDGYTLTQLPAYPVAAGKSDDEAHPGSPMPGRVVAVHVKAGDSVTKGQPLLVIEAMKMEYTLKARRDGKVERIIPSVGDMVEAEVPLVDLGQDGSSND